MGLNRKVGMGFLIIIMTTALAFADEIPNGKDAFIGENAVNIPIGKILLVKKGTAYCAVQFTSSRWSEEESQATYKSYYVADSTTSLLDPRVKPREDEVYAKQPFRIIGRLAIAREQYAIFCGEMTLRGSSGPRNSGWIYFDEKGTLEMSPTKWSDIRDINVSDKNLKWFKYGDVARYPDRQKVFQMFLNARSGYIKLPLQ